MIIGTFQNVISARDMTQTCYDIMHLFLHIITAMYKYSEDDAVSVFPASAFLSVLSVSLI